jgi:Terminase large subunit, T4likevirus-type, N-terminal
MGMMASDLVLALDPAAFSVAAGIDPDPWQAQLLRSTAPRILLNASRQSGKSTVTATLACHTALYHPGSLTLIVSPTERQSKELFRKALAVYRALGKPVAPESETALTLELENGSRLVALPGKEGSIRSYSGAALIAIDEASRVADETYMAVRPMLAVSHGRLIALSTPWGTRGWWYQAFRETGPGAEVWERYTVPATEVPRIDPDYLAQEQRTIGSWWFDQEFMTMFKDKQTAALRSEDVDRAIQDYKTWDFNKFMPTAPIPAVSGGPGAPDTSTAWNFRRPAAASWHDEHEPTAGASRRPLTPQEEAELHARRFEAEVKRMWPGR